MEMKEQLFDTSAKHYDDQFTNSLIGQRQRQRVYAILREKGLLDGSRLIFEFNCGTGFDADFFFKLGHSVTATDASEKMIEQCKTARNSSIQFYPLRIQDATHDQALENANFVFSNFGGLNCLNKDELKEFIELLSRKLKTDSQLAFVIMPKHCLWETVYFLMKGKWGEIGRRNKNLAQTVNVNGEEVPTFYHSPSELNRLLRQDFTLSALRPIAFFLPPSYMEPFFSKHPWLLGILNKFEILFSTWSKLAGWSDHYMLIAQRK